MQAARLQALQDELAAEVLRLPQVLHSTQPHLLVDYLATVFKEGDGQDVAGLQDAASNPPAAQPAKWALLEQMLQGGSDSEQAEKEAAEMDAAADAVTAEIRQLEREALSPADNLAFLTGSAPAGTSGRSAVTQGGLQDDLDLVVCSACKRIVLAGHFAAHVPVCKGQQQLVLHQASPTVSAGTAAGGSVGGTGARRKGVGPSKLSKDSRQATPQPRPASRNAMGRPPGGSTLLKTAQVKALANGLPTAWQPHPDFAQQTAQQMPHLSLTGDTIVKFPAKRKRTSRTRRDTWPHQLPEHGLYEGTSTQRAGLQPPAKRSRPGSSSSMGGAARKAACGKPPLAPTIMPRTAAAVPPAHLSLVGDHVWQHTPPAGLPGQGVPASFQAHSISISNGAATAAHLQHMGPGSHHTHHQPGSSRLGWPSNQQQPAADATFAWQHAELLSASGLQQNCGSGVQGQLHSHTPIYFDALPGMRMVDQQPAEMRQQVPSRASLPAGTTTMWTHSPGLQFAPPLLPPHSQRGAGYMSQHLFGRTSSGSSGAVLGGFAPPGMRVLSAAAPVRLVSNGQPAQQSYAQLAAALGRPLPGRLLPGASPRTASISSLTQSLPSLSEAHESCSA